MYAHGSPPKYGSKSSKMMGGSSCSQHAKLLSSTSSSSATTLSPSASSSSSTKSSSSALAAAVKSVATGVGGGGGSICRAGSTLSLHSNSSSSALLASGEKSHAHYQNVYHHHYSNTHHSSGGNGGGGRSAAAMKRGAKKHNWGTRERAGMSFLIVIAFFAVFGFIILTELFMIDERSHAGMVAMRHGGSMRLGDSMPDYDNVKDDYDLLDDNLLSDNKLGFVQFRDNKLKIQDADNTDTGRLTGILHNSALTGYGAAAGAGGGVGLAGTGNGPLMPWGKALPAKVEATLPHYPTGTAPTDGSWQVVNGTRFKFFVFSAYYDRRDGAKLVRIVGATKTRGPERVWCRFWYLNRNVSAAAGGERQQRPRYTSATVIARVKSIRENWNLKYSACFILCPVRDPDLEFPPTYVSVVARLRAPPGNLLEVRNTDWDPDFAVNRTGPLNASAAAASAFGTASASSATAGLPPPRSLYQIPDKMAICVKPFHFNYDQALYLMEYLEFYALLGVSHFTFYNHTIGPHANCVLQHYMDGDIPGNLTTWDEELTPAAAAGVGQGKTEAAPSTSNSNASSGGMPQSPPPKRYESLNYAKPTVQILPWNLRMRSQKEIRTEGLFAALNDCLYRTMYRYKYLALVDLDEFIVPRNDDTLNELISSLNRRFHNRNTGAYSFQNAFFYLQFADDALVSQTTANGANAQVRSALVTQRKTQRRFKLHPQKQRSKFICRPEAVIEAGNHFVWEFSPGKGSLNVPPTDAILQHYRVCEFGGNDCIKAPATTDRTATKYVNRLVQRVETVYKHLKQRCDLPDLPVLAKQMKMKAADVHGGAFRMRYNNNEINKVEQLNKHTKAAATTNTNENDNKDERTKATIVAGGGGGVTKTNTTRTMFGNATTSQTNATRKTTTTTTIAPPAPIANIRRKHKIVVFEKDDEGLTQARVQYV